MARTRHTPPDPRDNPQTFAAYLRERVYATFTGLAIVLVVSGSGHPTAQHAFLALLLGVVGIVVAGFVSELISHLVLHQLMPDKAELQPMLNVAAGGLATVGAPALMLGLAWLGILDLEVALNIATWIYVVTLALIGWLAVRRAKLSVPRQLVAYALLIGLGLLVILLQTLAKSV